MSGGDFVAVVRLSTKANVTLALPGETCERVPAASLEWLERGGRICRVTAEVTLPGEMLPDYQRGRRMKRSEGA